MSNISIFSFIIRSLSETKEHQKAKQILERKKYVCLKKWIANERMEALAAFLNLIFATIEYEFNYEGLRKDNPSIPYASRALITITTIFICSFELNNSVFLLF